MADMPEQDPDPWRILAAIVKAGGGRASVYADDVAAFPPGTRPHVGWQTWYTDSRPDGYRVIVLTLPGEGEAEDG